MIFLRQPTDVAGNCAAKLVGGLLLVGLRTLFE